MNNDKSIEYSRMKCSECGCDLGFIHYMQNVEGLALCDGCYHELQDSEDSENE